MAIRRAIGCEEALIARRVSVFAVPSTVIAGSVDPGGVGTTAAAAAATGGTSPPEPPAGSAAAATGGVTVPVLGGVAADAAAGVGTPATAELVEVAVTEAADVLEAEAETAELVMTDPGAAVVVVAALGVATAPETIVVV